MPGSLPTVSPMLPATLRCNSSPATTSAGVARPSAERGCPKITISSSTVASSPSVSSSAIATAAAENSAAASNSLVQFMIDLLMIMIDLLMIRTARESGSVVLWFLTGKGGRNGQKLRPALRGPGLESGDRRRPGSVRLKRTRGGNGVIGRGGDRDRFQVQRGLRKSGRRGCDGVGKNARRADLLHAIGVMRVLACKNGTEAKGQGRQNSKTPKRIASCWR